MKSMNVQRSEDHTVHKLVFLRGIIAAKLSLSRALTLTWTATFFSRQISFEDQKVSRKLEPLLHKWAIPSLLLI